MNAPRILIVEDEAVVARDLQQQLGELGYEPLRPTPRAEEAILLCGELRPNLVLMDINLVGKLDGIDAAREIRERFSIPVVFLTALTGDAVLERAKLAEPFGYIIKPFDERELRTVVEMALYKHQSELRQKEVRDDLAAVLRTALDGFWLTDMEGRILDANDACCRMHGFSREELLTKRISDFEVDESREEVAKTSARMVREGSGRFERRHRCRNGRLINVEISVNFRPARGGHFFAFLRDVTARRRQEAALQARLRLSESSATCSLDELLQKTLDEAELLTGSQVGFFHAVEADQKTIRLQVWSSNTLARMCQAEGKERHYSADQAGVWVDSLRERRPIIHNDYAALTHRKGLPAGHAPIVREVVVPVIKHGLVTAIFGVGNKPTDYDEDDVASLEALAAACWDLVDRKRAEQDRQKFDANISALLNSSTESIFMADRQGTVLVANEVTARRLGLGLDELIGSCVYDRLSTEVAVARRHRFDESFATGAPVRFVDQRNGRYYDQNVVPIRDEKGAVNRIAVFAADITENRESESILRAQERKMDRIFQTAPIGLGTAAGRVMTEVNSVFCELTGYAREELIGQDTRMLYPGDGEYERVGRELHDKLLPDGRCTVESRMRRKDGATIDVVISASLLHPEADRAAVIFSVTDVTARKAAEHALRTSESRLRQAQKIFGLGVWDWDIATDRTTWSGEMFKIYGITPEAFTGNGQDYIHFTHPEDRPIQVANIQRAFQRSATGPVAGARSDLVSLGDEAGPKQFRIVRPDGTICWVEGDAEAIVNKAGQPVAMIGTLVDITKRREAEAALRTSEERYRLLFNSSNDAVFVYSMSPDGQPGNYIEVNEVACVRMGYTRDELLKLSPVDLNTPASVAKLRSKAAVLMAEKRLVTEAEHVTKDGRQFPVEISAQVFDLKGRPAVLSVARDITDRKALEAQFRQAQKMEVIGQLAGGVAHDFNNILTAMMLNLELLRPVHPATETGSPLHELEAMIKRAGKLTQQLLMFARRQAIHVTPLELNGAVTGLLKMLRRLLGEPVELRFVTDHPSLWVEADAGMLDQAVMNLCINARDAMPDGGVLTLATTRVELDPEGAKKIPGARPGSFACLRVSDTGTGMPPEIMQHLFEPFFTTKEVGRGTGLGLASVHGIVLQHQGWITVESMLGAGTTFRIFLPSVKRADRSGENAEPGRRRPAGTEAILLVEDEEVVRKVSSLMLQRLGYRVVAAANGSDAIRCWDERGGAFDLLLADMVMPGGMNGRELGAVLQSRKPDLKIILMSGYSTEILRNDARNGTGTVFLAKPYESDVLAATIRRCLDAPVTAPA